MGCRTSATQDLFVLKVPAPLKQRTGFPELGGERTHCILNLNGFSAPGLGLQARVVLKSVFFKQRYMKFFLLDTQALAVVKKIIFQFAPKFVFFLLRICLLSVVHISHFFFFCQSLFSHFI